MVEEEKERESESANREEGRMVVRRVGEEVMVAAKLLHIV